MFRLLLIFCILFLLSSVLPSQATVYLNRRIIDPETGEYVIEMLDFAGTGLSLDRFYQNGYGEYAGLPPGPPFIVEHHIQIRNELDEDNHVVKYGSLSIDNFTGGLPEFVINFVDGSWNVSLDGNVNVYAAPWDPIIFTGQYEISSTYDGGNGDSTEVSQYSVHFENCIFNGMDDGFQIQSGNHTFIGCEFRNMSGPALTCLDRWDRKNIWTLEMRDCTFRNIRSGSYYIVDIEDLKELKLENLHFRNCIFPHDSPSRVLLEVGGCRLKDCIKGFTGVNNSVNFIYVSGRVSDSLTLQSTEDFPFRIGTIRTDPGSVLHIDKGSVMKMSWGGDKGNFMCKGRMVVDSSILTSIQDYKHGGKTYFWGEVIGAPDYWDGIYIDTTGSIEVINSEILFADGGIHSLGDVYVDGCKINSGEEFGIKLDAQSDNSLFARNTEVSNIDKGFGGEGIEIRLIDGSECSIDLQRVDVLDCFGSGLDIMAATNPDDITVHIQDCVLAGNRHGITVGVGPGVSELIIDNSLVLSNMNYGIHCEDYSSSEPTIEINNCVVARNGFRASSSSSIGGVSIKMYNTRFINNTVAGNRNNGFYAMITDSAASEVANNIFCNNSKYGYVKGSDYNESLLPLIANNVFFNNNDGVDEMCLYMYNGGLYQVNTVEELQAYGGEYATNMHIDPTLRSEFKGRIAGYMGDFYDEWTGVSKVVGRGAAFKDRDFSRMPIKPSQNSDDWYYVISNTDDTLYVAGNIYDVASVNDTFTIFDYHLHSFSELIDAGRNASVTVEADVEGDYRFLDGDENGSELTDIGADEYDPEEAEPDVITITSPTKGDCWFPSTPDTICWNITDEVISNVNIFWREQPTDTWTSVASDVAAELAEYPWTVPGVMSPRCEIKIEDAVDPNVWQKERFRIKPYLLTRMTPDSAYEAFDEIDDKWPFENVKGDMWPHSWWQQFDYNGTDPYTGLSYPVEFSGIISPANMALAYEFPDWPLFVEAFGVDQCYYISYGGLIFRPSAIRFWADNKDMWDGSCWGFANTAILAFEDSLAFYDEYPDVGHFNILWHLYLNDKRRLAVNRSYVSIYGDDWPRPGNLDASPKAIVSKLKDIFLNDEPVGVLNMYDTAGEGHAVAPFTVRPSATKPDVMEILVYDGNDTSSTHEVVEVDTVADNFSYGPLSWVNCTDVFLDAPAMSYLDPPRLPSSSSTKRFLGPASGPTVNLMRVLNRPRSDIKLTGLSGDSIGYVDSTFFNTIDNAEPIRFVAGREGAPRGYLVPDGPYTLKIDNMYDSAVSVSVYKDSVIYNYSRADADSSEVDSVCFGDGAVIYNPDDSAREVSLEADAITGTSETAFYIWNVIIDGGDSVAITLADDGLVEVVNNSVEQCYNLRLRYASADRGIVFMKDSIDLPSNSSHRIIPQWEKPQDSACLIIEDLGADGTYDDSLWLANEQPLSVDEEESGQLPAEFRLHQNHPNPFNSSTAIAFDLARKAHVELVVFNILGQRVKTLADGEYSPGRHLISWDGTSTGGKQVASGVYFYRIIADRFVSSRKMILVK